MPKMKNKINIVFVLLLLITATIFAMYFTSFFKKQFFASENFNETNSQIKNNQKIDDNLRNENIIVKNQLNGTQSQYILTIITDVNFSQVEINNVIVQLNLEQMVDENDEIVYYKTCSGMYDEGLLISLDFAFETGYMFDELSAFKTGFEADTFEIENNNFEMPSFDLTINLTSRISKLNLTINEIVYHNTTENYGDTNTYQSSLKNSTLLIADYGSNKEIIINAETCHLFNNNGYKYVSMLHQFDIDDTYVNDNVLSVIEDAYSITINIENITQNDTIDIYIEDDFYSLTIAFGANEDYDDCVGGTIDLAKNDSLFLIKKTNSLITANIYNLGFVDINCLSNVDYRYYQTSIVCEDEDEKGYDKIYDIDIDNNVRIDGIYKSLYLNVAFLKMYKVSVKVEKILIDDYYTKIGTIWYEGETATHDDLNRYYDANSPVNVETVIDEGYRTYEFKNWKVLNKTGEDIDLVDLGIIDENSIYKNKFEIYDLSQDVVLIALYGIKLYSVSIDWNGFYGTIESETESEDYVYKIIYGESLELKLTPKNDMHFLKIAKINNKDIIENENIESLEEFETYSIYKIENITMNLSVEIQFVKNTWWEHVDRFQLYGAGTKDIPYFISCPEDLAVVAYLVNNNVKELATTAPYREAYYLLYCDIDCGHDYYFIPIGTARNSFEGVFDFNYHKIENIWTEEDVTQYTHEGLFNVVGNHARIINKEKSPWPVIISIVGSIIIFGIAGFLVYKIESKNNKRKKVVVINEKEVKSKKIQAPKNVNNKQSITKNLDKK